MQVAEEIMKIMSGMNMTPTQNGTKKRPKVHRQKIRHLYLLIQQRTHQKMKAHPQRKRLQKTQVKRQRMQIQRQEKIQKVKTLISDDDKDVFRKPTKDA